MNRMSCISFDSYIKPQPSFLWFNTSISCISFDSYIKPQRYTVSQKRQWCCISFDSYIKPQRCLSLPQLSYSCISFDSYIKPQLARNRSHFFWVVYLLIPTSNHNLNCDEGAFQTLYIF